MDTLKVGIATLEQYKNRTMAIARGEYTPRPNEPKSGFNPLRPCLKFYQKRIGHCSR